ncbi:hypothetical protein ACFS5N_02275 [Mucilaginibacter ximonensis]|uniref:Uncharacterized protein n=1 Tax=Mucilaginibacter ximonensis TaxID=538021 RepID=A0ABW5Y924_9SPHI
MDVKAYIESGVLESYVLGSASPEEEREVLRLKKQYPEIADALFQIETDFEQLAQNMALIPPPGMLTRIEDEINAVIETEEALPPAKQPKTNNHKYQSNPDSGTQFIEVEASSNQMRIHKAWRWVFAGVFILGKIFLIAAIYFYFENRQAQERIQELKTELRQYKH